MTSSIQLDRRAMLKCLAGVTLALPLLEAMGMDVAAKTPRRFCAMYTANGMSLPNPKHGIDEPCCGRSPDRATPPDRRSPRSTTIRLAV